MSKKKPIDVFRDAAKAGAKAEFIETGASARDFVKPSPLHPDSMTPRPVYLPSHIRVDGVRYNLHFTEDLPYTFCVIEREKEEPRQVPDRFVGMTYLHPGERHDPEHARHEAFKKAVMTIGKMDKKIFIDACPDQIVAVQGILGKKPYILRGYLANQDKKTIDGLTKFRRAYWKACHPGESAKRVTKNSLPVDAFQMVCPPKNKRS